VAVVRMAVVLVAIVVGGSCPDDICPAWRLP